MMPALPGGRGPLWVRRHPGMPKHTMTGAEPQGERTMEPNELTPHQIAARAVTGLVDDLGRGEILEIVHRYNDGTDDGAASWVLTVKRLPSGGLAVFPRSAPMRPFAFAGAIRPAFRPSPDGQ